MTDDEIAKEIQAQVHKLGGLINDAELRGIQVKISQVDNYHVVMGQRPTSFLSLSITKSLLAVPVVPYTGGY